MKKINRKKLFNSLLVAVMVFMVTVPVFAEESTCEGVFNPETLQFLKTSVFKPIHIAVPVILVVLTTMDFAKSVFSNEKDGMEKAKKNFIRRAIVAVILFFIPNILEIVFDLIDEAEISKCIGQTAFKVFGLIK